MLKKKLKRNDFLYWPYLYYNLFLHHKGFIKRNKYSQGEEDTYINKYFKNIENGFYLDIGCFHPLLYSNTARLYNRGWSGINIDLNVTSIDLFNILRKRDKNFCAAISNKNEEVECYIDGNFSPLNSLNKKFSEFTIKNYSKSEVQKKRINTFRLLDFLKEKKIELKNLDFLNIDVESHDFKVLEGIELNKIKPRLICIEMFNEEGEIKPASFINHLKKFNYTMIYETAGNGFFERK